MSARRSRPVPPWRLTENEIKQFNSPSCEVDVSILQTAEKWNEVLADIRDHAERDLSYAIPGNDYGRTIMVKSAGEFVNIRVYVHDAVDYAHATCELGKFFVKDARGGVAPKGILTRHWIRKFLTVLLEDCKYDELLITESDDYYYAKITKVIEY